MSHTPGPWERKGNRIENDDRYIALVTQSSNGGYSTADGDLIAAAPCLLEALQDFESYVRTEQNSTDGAVQYSSSQIQRLVFKARAAIAKATGGAS